MKKFAMRAVLILAGGAKTVAVAAALVGTSTLVAAPAMAANPHFIGKVTATLDGGNVQVCWKEASLGGNQDVMYQASADASATYRCMNPGGTCELDPITVQETVIATGTFRSGKNGQVTQCLTIEAPPPPVLEPAQGGCPPAWDPPTLTDITYSNIKITDVTNLVGVPATPSALGAVIFDCP